MTSATSALSFGCSTHLSTTWICLDHRIRDENGARNPQAHYHGGRVELAESAIEKPSKQADFSDIIL
jgi:hypothetical protein